MMKLFFAVLVLAAATASAFVIQPARSPSTSTAPLQMVGPLNKVFNKGDYEKTIGNLMKVKGYTREQAEKEYDSYLENPTNYALSKGEEYYKSLGYNTLMEGIVGEADKEGKGDEVRERLANFKKQSQFKALGFLAVFWGTFLYFKIAFDADNPLPPPPM